MDLSDEICESKVSKSLLDSELKSLMTYLNTYMFCQNLGALKDGKAMTYAKQIRGSIEELSTACKMSHVYSLDNVTT